MKGMFGSYLSPDSVDEIIRSGNQVDFGKKEIRTVEFVWIWIDDSCEEFETLLAKATDLGGQYGAVTDSIFLPVVSIYFGMIPTHEFESDARQRLVDSLCEEFGQKAKCHHGCCEAQVGNFGGSTRLVYTVSTGSRSELLSSLASLPFGQYTSYENRG